MLRRLLIGVGDLDQGRLGPGGAENLQADGQLDIFVSGGLVITSDSRWRYGKLSIRCSGSDAAFGLAITSRRPAALR